MPKKADVILRVIYHIFRHLQSRKIKKHLTMDQCSVGGFAEPAVEEGHLFRGVEPVFAAGHDRELCADPGDERGHRFGRGQEIAVAVQDAGGDGPSKRMPAHVAEPVPGERLAEADRDFFF